MPEKNNSMIHDNVEIGEGTMIEEFCIVGIPPRGKKPGELKTIIGKNCHIRSHTTIYAGNIIGDNFQTGHHVNLREDNRIGNNVSIGTKSVIEHHVEIEDDVRIHSIAFIPEYCTLKKGCWIGPGVFMTNAPFPLSPNAKKKLRGVKVMEGAKVGANSTLLPGVTIGAHALVGSGSVVTKDVPEKKVVVGNPAKDIKHITELEFDDGEKAYPDLS